MRQLSTHSNRQPRRPQHLLACLLAASCSPLTALAAAEKWASPVSGNFSNNTLWSPTPAPGPGPGVSDVAVFNVAGTYTVTFTAGAATAGFQVQQGNVTWNAGPSTETYTVTGSPSVSGGSLTLGTTGAPLTVVTPTLGVQGTGSPILNVTGNSTLSTGNLSIATNSVSGFSGILNDSSNITQSGASTLTIGAASQSSGTLNLNAGVYNTGTGLTTINATGQININGGNFNEKGDITLTGGSLTQTAGAFTWTASHTMTIQSGANVTLTGFYGTPANANITVSGAGSQLNDTGTSTAELFLDSGTTLSVNSGASVHSDRLIYILNSTVTIDGAGSSFSSAGPASGLENLLGFGGNGFLTFSNNASGSATNGFRIGDSGSHGTLSVQSNATLSTGPLDIAVSTDSAVGVINLTGGTLNQTGSSTLTLGASSLSSATITVGANGTFNTGKGLTTINPTGNINITGGAFNANGNITLAGGSLTQTAGTFTWAANHTMTIQSGGNFTLLAAYSTPTNATINVTGAGSQLNDTGSSTADLAINNGSTLSVNSGAAVHSDRFLDIAGTGNGTVTVDGAGSSFSSAASSALPNNLVGTGGTGSLTFSNNATCSAPSGFQIGLSSASNGTLNVFSNATLSTGPIALANNSLTANGTLNVTGGTLTQSGNSTLIIGASSLSTATVTIGANGTFNTGTGLTSINPTGKINLTGGAFNENGNITLTGGSLNQTGGNFTWAASHTMTIQSGGNFTLLGAYTTPNNSVITITGAGSQLNDTGSSLDLIITNCVLSVAAGGAIHSDRVLDIENANVTVDGTGSSFSANAPVSAGTNDLGTAGTASLTFSNNATGSVTNGFQIGLAAGSNATLNVLSNASLTTGPIAIANVLNHATGTINVTGGTLTQTGTADLTLGLPSQSSAIITIDSAGTFTTGTGLTSIQSTGYISLTGGAFNANGNITLVGGFFNQTGGNFTWAANHTMTILFGGNFTLLGAYATPNNAFINVNGAGSQLNDTGSLTADLAINNGATLSVAGGATLHSDQFLDIAGSGNGTVTVDGANSSLIAVSTVTLGSNGTGSLTFSNKATGSLTNGLQIGFSSGSNGTLNVLSNATLSTGPIALANSSVAATGTVNVTGGTLIQTSNSTLIVGASSLSNATVTIGSGGTFFTGLGLTSINTTGKINLTGGTFNARGNITLTGGSLNQTGGNFIWAASYIMTIQSGGKVNLLDFYSIPADAIINVTGVGSQLNDMGSSTADLFIKNGATLSVTSGATVHSDQFIDIAGVGNGTVTVDGAGSSFSTAALASISENILGIGGTGSLTFSNNATGSATNGFHIGLSNGSHGTLNVQSNATVSAGSIIIANSTLAATGTLNVTAGTLTQTGNATLTVGASSISSANVTIGTGGIFTTGTGNITINATGQINISGGTINQKGFMTIANNGIFTSNGTLHSTADVTNSGNFTQTGPQTWSNGTTFTNSGNATLTTDTGTNSTSPLNILNTAGKLLLSTPQHINSLNITGGNVTLPTTANLRQDTGVVLKTSSLSIAASSILDVTNHDLIIGNSDLATINTEILNGFGDGPGGAQITSSTATGGAPTFLIPLDAAAFGISSWDNVPVTDPNTIIVKYATFGDATLDGLVNSDDFGIVISNLGTTTAGPANIEQSWIHGDVNLDGLVNADDFGVIISNLGSAPLAGPPGNTSPSNVPEPASFTLLSLTIPLLLRRRKNESILR